ncbi:hypothetical protein Salat_1330100 [Sesamum alatum]|uniref:Uncharacterized protein n=1 Tax=Sesamum alatum TaxID=300844 RepID=A0AAE2CQD3_9LAMI|nr:hypothetical protein Salat_1330100 [Sesamum alatum]
MLKSPSISSEAQRRQEKVIMYLHRRRQRFTVTSLILLVFLVGMGSVGESTRTMKSRVYASLIEQRLPRGPVPPSAPSFCHNRLNPLSESNLFNFPPPHHDIICP